MIFPNLEAHIKPGFHVGIIYVVDGYEAIYYKDEFENIKEARGETIIEALWNLDIELCDPKTGQRSDPVNDKLLTILEQKTQLHQTVELHWDTIVHAWNAKFFTTDGHRQVAQCLHMRLIDAIFGLQPLIMNFNIRNR